MKVVTLKDIPILPAEGAAERTEGWTGPVFRTRQTIVQPGESDNFTCSVVNFSQGCNTGWHSHDCDQMLIVTSGSGIAATEHEQREINEINSAIYCFTLEKLWPALAQVKRVVNFFM